jgi:hypothetical protein
LQNLPDNQAGLVWSTDRSKITGTEVYKWRSKRGHTFILGLHTMVFQVEIYAIMGRIMENIERATKVGTLISSLTVKQPLRHLISR